MDNYALMLFKGFLRHVKSRVGEGLSFPELLDEFLSDELDLDYEEDKTTRLSLTKRFHSLARKHVPNPRRQASLSQYLEV